MVLASSGTILKRSIHLHTQVIARERNVYGGQRQHDRIIRPIVYSRIKKVKITERSIDDRKKTFYLLKKPSTKEFKSPY